MTDKNQNFPKRITEDYIHPFSVDKNGFYAIFITASCRSGKQIGQYGGEDLQMELNGIKFREIPPISKTQYRNIPISWNGTELKGLPKTVVLLLRLATGNYELKLIPTRGAGIEEISRPELLDGLGEVRVNIEKRARDGDRRPWYAFALFWLPLESITAEASVDWHFFDGDDVKLIVDGDIKRNPESKRHRDWAWSASIWDIFRGRKKEAKPFDVDLPVDIHYVEFWADKTPDLHNVAFNFGDYKKVPTVFNPEWMGDYDDDLDDLLLARLIFGEAENQSRDAKIGVGFSVLNRVKKQRANWGYTLKEVVLKADQYDALWNPGRQDKVRNPLKNAVPDQKRAWYESYEIASSIINGSVADPTDGATSFHSFINQSDFPPWATEDRFKVKIGRMYFYELER